MAVTKRKGRAAPSGQPQAKHGAAEDDEFDMLMEASSPQRSLRERILLPIVSFVACGVLLLLWLLSQRRGNSPYAVSYGGVKDDILQQALKLGQRVVESGAGEQKRSFGTGQQYLAQHSIIYLHGPAGDSAALREIAAALRRVGENAAKKQGWLLGSKPLVPRCVELIKYTSSSGLNLSESIGWHDDGATHLTVAAPLDERQSYDGGSIEVLNSDGATLSVAPTRGDAVVWRGWHRHRVLPITRGERNVLVAEFWSERLGESWNEIDGRPLDDTRRYLDALELDPASPALHEGLGVLAAKREQKDLAEKSFRQAVALNPRQASAFTGLGVVLQHEDKLTSAMAAIGLAGMKTSGSPHAAEAEDALHRAIDLDPTMPAAPYDLSLLLQRTGRHSEAETYKQLALRLDPLLLHSDRKEGESAASQLHS